MKSSASFEQVMRKALSISNRKTPFESCFERLLELLVDCTSAECGCILAEFENTDRIVHAAEGRDATLGTSLQNYLAAQKVQISSRLADSPFLLIDNLTFDYDNEVHEHTGTCIVFPLADADRLYGLISLIGTPHTEKDRGYFQLLHSTVIQLLAKLYAERQSRLLRKYHTLESAISKLLFEDADIEQIPSIILRSLALFSVTLIQYDVEASCIDIIMEASKKPVADRKSIRKLHVDLSSHPALRSRLDNLHTSTVIDSEAMSSDRAGGDTEPIAGRIFRALSDDGASSLLLSPASHSTNGKQLIIAFAKKGSGSFMKSHLPYYQNLTQIVSLAIEKRETDRIHSMQARSSSVIQKIARRIIEDSDISSEATNIKHAFNAHCCFIFTIARTRNTFAIEGVSTGLPGADVKKLKSISLSLEELNAAGYPQSALHQVEVARVDEYLEAVQVKGGEESNVVGVLSKYKNHSVIRAPLFDSFRRLQGFILIIKKPYQKVLSEDTKQILDFSSRIGNALEIRNNIYIDSLTGLPNIKKIRPIVVDRLISSQPFSLMICKIINLKEIVISRGDEIVDTCMIIIADRIRTAAECHPEKILIGRNSGEASFTLIYPGTSETRLQSFVLELIESISRPIHANGNMLSLNANVGICHSTDIWDTDMVFNYGKLAILSISDQRNTYFTYDTDQQRKYQEEKELEKDIREAIASRQFYAHYQPKVRCDGSVEGFEALARWNRNGTTVSPGIFIEKVENMGLMKPLFEIIFEKLCRDLAKSRAVRNISINISPSQLADIGLLDFITSQLTQYGISPQSITFEFIESALLNSEYFDSITQLKALGFKLSLDDFGTGYARYKTLIDLFNQRLINEIKIDKVFIDGIKASANQSFVRSICYLANEFDIRVVVEGVETREQLSLIETIDPGAIIQGWLFSKALPIEEAEQFGEKKLAIPLSLG